MRTKRISFVFVSAASLILYIYTLASGWGAINIFNTWDGLEYVLCSALLGIDHPPGHPFYLLLTRLFAVLVPIGSIAYRMNLFSAVFGALSAGMVFLITEKLLSMIGRPKEEMLRAGAAGITALVFAASKVFWLHSLITEVHTLYVFLMALVLYFILRFIECGEKKWLISSAFFSGIMICTSIMNALTFVFPAAFLLLAYIIFIKKQRLDLADFLKSVVSFIAGASFYFYYAFALMMGPGYVHSMNLSQKEPLGSIGWFIWFISGKAWTGDGMFSLSRVLSNLPNYLWHLADNFGFISLAFFVVSFAWASASKKAKSTLSPGSSAFLLLFIGLFFVLIPQLSLQDVSNPGSTTFIYVANFFVPSFFLFAVISGVGLGIALDLLWNSPWMPKNWIEDARMRRSAMLVILYVLAIFPMCLVSANYKFCNLKDENTGYDFAKGVILSLPDRAVVFSKLVFQQVGTYFMKIEPISTPSRLVIENPDDVVKEMSPTGNSGMGFMIQKTDKLKASILTYLRKGYSVYLSGDCVDQDKAPEILLISDIIMHPDVPQSLYPYLSRPFPTELLPYRIEGFREASRYFGTPKVDSVGVSNDGDFFSSLKLIGFASSKEKPWITGRNRIAIELYWKVLERVPEDLTAIFTVFDGSLRRVDPARTSSFFTVGGADPSSRWAKGETVKEDAYFFLPGLAPGKYYLAFGLLRADGSPLPYYPANHKQTGQSFDFILLLPFEIGGAR